MNKTLFFDFDGTIADSEKGIVNGIKYMIDDMHLAPLAPSAYRDWIGPSLTFSMQKYYPGMDYQRGIESYREYYLTKGMYELQVYDGVTDMLQQLKDDGYQLALASAKPEKQLLRIVDKQHLRSLFNGAYGASNDEKTRISKTDILAYAIASMHAHEDSSVMIGDRFTDMEGGRNNQVHTLGVTYGFGDAAELEKAGADMVVNAPAEIVTASHQLL